MVGAKLVDGVEWSGVAEGVRAERVRRAGGAEGGGRAVRRMAMAAAGLMDTETRRCAMRGEDCTRGKFAHGELAASEMRVAKTSDQNGVY